MKTKVKVVFTEYVSPLEFILSDVLPEVNGVIMPAVQIHSILKAAGHFQSFNRTERALYEAVHERKLERFKLLLPNSPKSVYHYRRITL